MKTCLLSLLCSLLLFIGTPASAQTDAEYEFLESAFEEAKLAFTAKSYARVVTLYDTVSAILPTETPSLELALMAHQSCQALLLSDSNQSLLETKAAQIYSNAVRGHGPLIVDEYLSDPRVVEEGYIFPEVDEDPIYSAGEDALYDLLINEINYPEAAREADVEGTVIVLFIINKDGSASGFYVDKGLSPELDAEALRVASMANRWIPAKQGGKAVYSYAGLPITFVLSE